MYQRESDRVESTPDLERSYFDVLGICCSSEIPLVENILNKLEGVKDVKVIVVTKTVIVIHGSLISSTQIVDALNRARLEASIKVSGESLDHKNKWPSPYAIASGVLLLISFLKYVYHPLIWVALVAVVSGIFPVAWKGLRAVMNCRIDINILVLVAVVGTIALSDYLESAAIVFLFCIAEWLESRATHKASAAMSSLVGIAPPKAILADTGEAVDVGDVKLDTILAVKPGDIIPIDGIVVDGKSEVDEKTLTGEFFPVGKEIDSQVWAGTINLNGYLSVRTTALAADCVIAKMAKLVEEAQNKKSRTQRLVDEFTKFYSPVVLVISISVALIPVAFTVQNQDYWFHLALVVLVSACPCALILSTPVVTFCALTKAAKGGLLVKGGEYLETLGKIRTVAFDKTGTITRGEFEVADFRCIGKDQINLETLLYWVSSIESKSSHPLATPLIQYARTSGIEPKPEDVDEFQNFPGEGIYGKIDGKDVFIGNKKIAIKAGYDSTLSLPGNGNGGETVGYVFAGSNIVGIFSLYDECRSGVTEAIEELKLLKIRTAMVTGDSQEAAMHAQDQVDHTLDLVYAELLPEDKSKIVESLRMEGPVAMVGDGVNDAPALATADIGISMGISGSALATETGHIILMSNDIGKIPKAIVLAKKSRKKVVENLILSIATKTPILALAFAGHPLIWAAVLADSGTCILVIFNSMLLLREDQGQRGLEEKCRRRVSNTRSYRTNSNKASAAAAAPKSKCQCCKVDPLRELLIT